ncbi:hypothetical protein [Bradyrhizobium sp. SRS-191]|uniref:hypothetical protein n=1 Tax=Bradyrhizobium sp. SRS-191 TaxID=2962606 RepID=UPI00211EBCD2|nr:hypothetical protein [Bradyrhizobium sp. SRS-191]
MELSNGRRQGALFSREKSFNWATPQPVHIRCDFASSESQAGTRELPLIDGGACLKVAAECDGKADKNADGRQISRLDILMEYRSNPDVSVWRILRRSRRSICCLNPLRLSSLASKKNGFTFSEICALLP